MLAFSSYLLSLLYMRYMFNIAASLRHVRLSDHTVHASDIGRRFNATVFLRHIVSIVGSYACPSDFRLPLPLFRATPSSVFVPFKAFLVALVCAPVVRLSTRIIPTNCCFINVIYSNVHIIIYCYICHISIFIYYLFGISGYISSLLFSIHPSLTILVYFLSSLISGSWNSKQNLFLNNKNREMCVCVNNFLIIN